MAKVIIVEDDVKLAQNYQQKLTQEGFEAKISEDTAAVETIRAEKPDLVLLDLLMPKVHGLTILRELKMDAELETIPVLILTNVEGANELSEAIAFGASGYLVKADTNLNILVSKVKEAINSQAIGTGIKS
ncbi:MAG TPA: response regulator [Patescibacteria group bacterium]|nr:response regulator [Patescibacteria group bacterium]